VNRNLKLTVPPLKIACETSKWIDAMSDKKDDKTVENPIAPAGSLINPGKDATVELTEEELGEVAGGLKIDQKI
jgi:hypothetical protein